MESTSRKTEYACLLDKFVVKEMIWVTNVMQLELEMIKRLEMLEEIA